MARPVVVESQPVLGPDGNPQDDYLDPSANFVIIKYLLDNVGEFRELTELRKKGWSNPKGDTFFKHQRKAADKASARTAMVFYKLMKRIGKELNTRTRALTIRSHDYEPPAILDMCMAPGGFLATALDLNPGSCALAFSLPVSNGGHNVLLPEGMDVDTRFLDITMLAEDMGADEIPDGHADAASFLPRVLETEQRFDLIICDGQVLRTHARASYRQKVEGVRLRTTQLALGVEHIRPGGTMVVLLHKVEAWETVNIIREFHGFSSVRLYKPNSGHRTRSSFYMVATNIQSESSMAKTAVDKWKLVWKVATFGSEDDYKSMVCGSERAAEELVLEFGETLVTMARQVWRVQATALAEAPFIS